MGEAFVPERQADRSQARKAWVACREIRPGRPKSLPVQIGAKLRRM